jgi:cation transport protein ChaC
VTLIERSFWSTLNDHHTEAPSGRVWGVAYRILPSKVAEVREYLDIREINGYTIHYTPFYPADGTPSIQMLVYIGTPENEQFVGPQEPQELAEHIYKSVGPSGQNKDYLLCLDVALEELSPESGDGHIADLARRVRILEEQERVVNGVENASQATNAIAVESHVHTLDKISSTDKQEEMEK